MTKYVQLLKNWLSQHLIYRARVLIWFLFDSLHFLIFPFLWFTVYGARDAIGGFSRGAMVTYYLVAVIISSLATSHIGRLIRFDIIRGELNQHLVKPLPYIVIHGFRDLAFHVLIAPLVLGLLGVAHILFPTYVILPTGANVIFFILAIGCSYLLSSMIEIILGLAAFWLGETTGADQIKNISIITFSGQLAPLVFFPAVIQTVADWLPFKYLVYFPAQIYLGQLTAPIFWRGLSVCLLWIGILLCIGWFLWKRGLYRYDGAGI